MDTRQLSTHPSTAQPVVQSWTPRRTHQTLPDAPELIKEIVVAISDSTIDLIIHRPGSYHTRLTAVKKNRVQVKRVGRMTTM